MRENSANATQTMPSNRTLFHSPAGPWATLVDVVVNVSVYVDHLTTDTQTLSYNKLDVYQSSIQFLT